MLSLLEATRDEPTAPHDLQHDAYLFVIEGTYWLKLGEHDMHLRAGTELHVPGGGSVSGRVKAGTRLYGLLPPQAR